MDETLVEDAITSRTKAIVAVHYAAIACEMDAIVAIAARHGVPVIEDAAQSLLARYKGRALGSIGDLAALSFHESKNIICGEGGALLVNRAEWIERAEIVHEKGTDRSKFMQGLIDKYTWVDFGSSYPLSELNAAFLWAQLEHAEEITARRRAIWDAYHESLAQLEADGRIRRPIIPEECEHNGHLYYVLLTAADRARVLERLNDAGVNAVFHYVPLHESTAGRRFGRAHGALPTTNDAAARLVRLPLWAGMESHHVERVVDVLARVLDAVPARVLTTVFWRNCGLLSPAPVAVPWAVSHAALPIVAPGEDGTPRLLFSARDTQGRAHIGAASLDLAAGRAAPLGNGPLLGPGELGAFDDNGVTGSCVVADGSRRYLYYTGWSLGVTVPFYLFAGLAISEDAGRTYRRVSRAPILPRDDGDPFLTASPWVVREGDQWRMWYVSGSAWEAGDPPRHRYRIKHAVSADGISWQRNHDVCIDYADEDEYAFGRPCVLYESGRFHMWYSSRGSAYRIGYAVSDDGLLWERRDADAGIEPSNDWDSVMQTYPIVVDAGGERYLLYNGNGYGETGVGYAALTSA